MDVRQTENECKNRSSENFELSPTQERERLIGSEANIHLKYDYRDQAEKRQDCDADRKKCDYLLLLFPHVLFHIRGTIARGVGLDWGVWGLGGAGDEVGQELALPASLKKLMQ